MRAGAFDEWHSRSLKIRKTVLHKTENLSKLQHFRALKSEFTENLEVIQIGKAHILQDVKIQLLTTSTLLTTSHSLLTAFFLSLFFLFLCTIFSRLESYHTGRAYTVTANYKSSRPVDASFGVSEGWCLVLSSSLSTIHLSPLWLKPILSTTSLLPMTHSYFISVLLFRYTLVNASTDLKTWMSQNKLKLNDDKT